MMNLRVAKFGKFRPFWSLYAGLIATGALLVAGVAGVVEMIYHMQLNAALGPTLRFFGMTLDTSSATSWSISIGLMVVGGVLLEMVRRRFVRAWGHAQEEIELEIKRGGMA